MHDQPIERLATTRSRRLPAAGLASTAVIVLAAIAAVPLLETYQIRVINDVLIYALLASALNIVIGYAGLLDLGFVAFFAIGAYSYALLDSPFFGVHLPFIAALALGAAFGAGAGILLGIPVLRLRGDYLAIVTLGFGEIIRILLNNVDALTNGPKGIMRLYTPELFGWTLSTPQDFYFLLLGLVAIVFTLVYRLEKSVLGLAWAAIREDQDAARGIGINTTFAKLCAFSTSASIGGLAGVIFAAYQRFVSPESFTFDVSLLIALIVVAGGIGNLVGVLVGAIILVVLPEALRGYDQYRMLIYGIVLVLIIMARPRGIVPRRYGIEWALRMLGWK